VVFISNFFFFKHLADRVALCFMAPCS